MYRWQDDLLLTQAVELTLLAATREQKVVVTTVLGCHHHAYTFVKLESVSRTLRSPQQPQRPPAEHRSWLPPRVQFLITHKCI